MKDSELAHLTDDELRQQKENIATSNKLNALLIGVFTGIAVYSAVKNGFGFFTFFPLFFVYVLVRNGKKSKALEQEIKGRHSA